MSKKDYQKIAEVFKANKPHGKIAEMALWSKIITGMVTVLKEDNERFDIKRFYRACGIEVM